MFWHMAGLSATSPIESLLDREGFTLEELLDEDELIQECKSLNNRLINFLRGKSQIQQLLKYVVEEPPEGSDNKRIFKFPFISCEIFTCEIEIILKTLVEDDELMGLLFSFISPDRPHGALLAGYFSKVVVCLIMRKTTAVMRYLQAHKEILKQLVDLISITSIMEVLIRLMGADDNIRPFHEDYSLRWLADTDLLEMLVDKLGPLSPSEAHANAADALSSVSRLSQSELAVKLSSPSFIKKIFHQALEAKDSRSTMVHSLSVCISLLDPKKYIVSGIGRGQQLGDSLVTINPEVIEGMLQSLGDFLNLLDVSTDKTVLPTTYGELLPPLGTHRLKIVEFLAVLLRTNNEEVRQELVRLGAIKLVLKLFFDYPFNNLLHHQVENIVISCFESNSRALTDHILLDCNFVARLLETDGDPYIRSTDNKPTMPSSRKAPPKTGNLGHLTRLANRLIQVSNRNPEIKEHLQGNAMWVEWQTSVLQSRNSTENVTQWACGRPSTMRDRPVDSDDEEYKGKDYDMPSMTSKISHDDVFRYGAFGNDDDDEGAGIADRDDDDVFFDDESAEVVISTLRLGEEHGGGISKDSFLSGSNWFSQVRPHFEDHQGTNGSSPNSSSSDDDVVVGEDDDLADTATSSDNGYFPVLGSRLTMFSEKVGVSESVLDLNLGMEKLCVSNNLSLFNDENRPDDWANWKEPMLEGTTGRMVFSDTNPFKDENQFNALQVSLIEEDGKVHQEQNKECDDTVQEVHENSTAVSNDDIQDRGQEDNDSGEHVVTSETENSMNAPAERMDQFQQQQHQPSNLPETDADPSLTESIDFNDNNYWRRSVFGEVTTINQ